MTEAKWLACADPRLMLEFLRGKVSERKLRLFACDYCREVRRTESLGPGGAVTVAERYADGLATEKDLAAERRGFPFPDNYSEWVLASAAFEGAWQGVQWLTSAVDLMAIDPDALRHFPNIPAQKIVKRSVSVLRDIFNNPFRPITLDPTWLTSTVIALAQQMYDSRDFCAMPILADALQDAGCENEEILNHCRKPGAHVHGCYVIDLLLCKK